MAKEIKKKSNIFCIDIDKDCESTVAGFVKEYVETTKISDGDSVKDRASINKMCTSIPTPFARMFLFRTAFKEVQERQESMRNEAIMTHEETGLYNYLVSDCLDMLEFIFYYGYRQEFGVVTWNAMTELDKQLSPTDNSFKASPEHVRLARALKEHLKKDNGLKNTDNIYLFTWNGVVVGGTSPFSLVYTSPNWVREKRDMKFEEFRAGEGDEEETLFDNDPSQLRKPRPLFKRSENFRKYMYEMWLAYGSKNLPNDFEKYIKQSYELYDSDLDVDKKMKGKPSEFDKAYPIKLHRVSVDDKGKSFDDPANVIVTTDVTGASNPIPLRTISTSGMIVNDSYKIAVRTDDELPFVKGDNGSERVQRPLVLSSTNSILGAKYFQNRPWDSYMSQMPSYLAEEPDYWKRKLPGTSKNYPYLRVEDFLEDKVICVAKPLSKRYFLSGNNGEITYLPPLKKLFFQYFRLGDLYQLDEFGNVTFDNGNPVKKKKSDGSDVDVYNIVETDDGVLVTLRIPVTDGCVELKKSYDGSEIVYYDNGAENKQMDLSVFPFYRIVYDIENAVDQNKYSVMLGYLGVKNSTDEKRTPVDLRFYADDAVTEIPALKTVRVQNSQNVNTCYYEVDKAFSLIEVEISTPGCEARALVVPFFERVKLKSKTFVFCVDFGTSNTHIAYAEMVGGDLDWKNIKNFDYGIDKDEKGFPKDVQVVHLFAPGGFPAYKTAKSREFVPDIIMLRNNREEANAVLPEVAFPIATQAIVQKDWFDDTTSGFSLFGNVSVGFFYDRDNESTANVDNAYKANIKWRQDGKSANIRQAFFNEIMWLIKNKVVLNEGSLDFYFYFTYPQSMDTNSMKKFFNYWNQARLYAKAGDISRNMQLNDEAHPIEGIVPWFWQLNDDKVQPSDRYMNIDIGGGTMDMVYQVPSEKSDDKAEENYTFSAMFAGDDLWGDGINFMAAPRKKNNAFLQDYMNNEEFSPKSKSEQDKFEAFKIKAENSAQVINSLFKEEGLFRFSEFVVQSKLITLVVMHFVAIAYYMGLVLQKRQLFVPNKVGFTGMGSLYLNMLSPKKSHIEEIIKSVLAYQGFTSEEGLNDLKVVIPENPKEVTAKGGVIFHSDPMGLKHIPTKESYVWGFDGENVLSKLADRDVPMKEDNVMTNIENYIDYFYSPEFDNLQDSMHVNWQLQFDKDVLMELARTSFRDYNRMVNENTGKMQKDPIFFWPLKDLLFNYGLKLISK